MNCATCCQRENAEELRALVCLRDFAFRKSWPFVRLTPAEFKHVPGCIYWYVLTELLSQLIFSERKEEFGSATSGGRWASEKIVLRRSVVTGLGLELLAHPHIEPLQESRREVCTP